MQADSANQNFFHKQPGKDVTLYRASPHLWGFFYFIHFLYMNTTNKMDNLNIV